MYGVVQSINTDASALAVEYAAKESATAVYNPEVNNLLVVRMTRLIPVFC